MAEAAAFVIGVLLGGAVGIVLSRTRMRQVDPVPIEPRLREHSFTGPDTRVISYNREGIGDDPEAWHLHIRIVETDYTRVPEEYFDNLRIDLNSFWQAIGGTDLKFVPPPPLLAKRVRADRSRRADPGPPQSNHGRKP